MANETLTEYLTVYDFDFCLEDGDYTFILGDHPRWQDGLCCNHGDGGYALYVNDQEIVSEFGADLFERKVFQITLPYTGETVFS